MATTAAASSLGPPPPSSSTASSSPPALQVNGSTTSGENSIKRAELRMTMFQKLRPYLVSCPAPEQPAAYGAQQPQAVGDGNEPRPYPLKHEWLFWHDRNNPNAAEQDWEDQLKEIAQISTVQSFWQVYNNTPFTTLSLRDSLHLFKKNVKPIWEDSRNKNGGAWTFRVPKANSQEFWKEVLMMAIGEILQEVVERGDDICGVSISVRFNSHLIMIWNRDGSNQKSIDAILAKALDSLSEALIPAEQNIYYKKHSSHKSFKGNEDGVKTDTPSAEIGSASLA